MLFATYHEFSGDVGPMVKCRIALPSMLFSLAALRRCSVADIQYKGSTLKHRGQRRHTEAVPSELCRLLMRGSIAMSLIVDKVFTPMFTSLDIPDTTIEQIFLCDGS